jgi:glutamate dehydrogenase/leucine dehydrogenase
MPATDEAVELLFQRGIYFIPDFISHAGAVMSGPVAQGGGTLDDVFRILTEVLVQLTRDILSDAREEGVNPRSLAVRRCQEKVSKARLEKKVVLSEDERLELYRQRFKI